MKTSHAGERLKLAKGKAHGRSASHGPVDDSERSILGESRYRKGKEREDRRKTAERNRCREHDGNIIPDLRLPCDLFEQVYASLSNDR